MGTPIHIKKRRKIAQTVKYFNKSGEESISEGWNDDYILHELTVY